MEWIPEKMCSKSGEYDLRVERHKHGYECDSGNGSWKWAVINSGVVVSQGVSNNLETAQIMAEKNLPLN